MFIHFGPYSALGGVHKGKEIHNGYSEQIMSHAPIPLDEYAQMARSFNPVQFDPESIVKLAQDAGMKFIVITSKHHDGFNMFQTKFTDYNIVDWTNYRQDVVKQLSQACARHNMKFGVYYSSIDWHYPGATPWTDDNNNPIPKTHEDFNVNQLKELASNYGPLSEIWFDMGKPTPAQSKRFTDTVHALQPDCMVSGRVFNHQGDFTVMGDNHIPPYVIDEPWQTPASIYSETWGYRSWEKRDNLQGKIQEHILKLAQVVSRGGNYILNIGPRGDGSVVDFEADVLKGVGAWLKVNGEAVYGTSAQPFRELKFGYATTKGNRLFLMVRDWPADGKLELPGLETPLKRAYMLDETHRQFVTVDNEAPVKSVQVTSSKVAGVLPVVVAELEGTPEVIPPTVKPAPDGRFTLLEKDADHFYNYNGEGYYERPSIYKEQWTLAIAKPASYQATVTYEKPEQTDRELDLLVDHNAVRIKLSTAMPDPGNPAQFKSTVKIGAVSAAPFTTVKVTPPEPFVKGDRLGVKVISVELSPLP